MRDLVAPASRRQFLRMIPLRMRLMFRKAHRSAAADAGKIFPASFSLQTMKPVPHKS